ncbi:MULTISPECIES: dual specificity protein phosphatase family protein [unclassified Vibrio]|uniref:Dual specificity protein phosphatase family protein n=1 Tax=Vibrio sp. HB236076 TaxID=3232307 RepID=A0AB39HG49_9VIBR|nr:dual specificity protein phosphatase family protein [Vibrio sp. HB161653]MDP5255604.1 dual specificity protein phosphatase family protein [Vibrio sp. HB161653]
MKKWGAVLAVIAISTSATAGGYFTWHKHLNYNFGTISEGKVYKLAAINPEKLKKYTDEYGIKTIIDLRNEITKYPSEELSAAADAIEGLNYINIRSKQTPDKHTLTAFYQVLDNPDNYPVLIHCYHGLGRTMLYTALYRIEYEGVSNEEARSKTRWLVESPIYDSSFAKGKSEGDFLINYKPRTMGMQSTLQTIATYESNPLRVRG